MAKNTTRETVRLTAELVDLSSSSSFFGGGGAELWRGGIGSPEGIGDLPGAGGALGAGGAGLALPDGVGASIGEICGARPASVKDTSTFAPLGPASI